MILEPFIVSLLSYWLEITELVKLDSASCTKLHAAIVSYMQSAQFKQDFHDNIKFFLSYNHKCVLNQLQWARSRGVHVPGMVVWISNKQLVYDLYHDESIGFPFISVVRFHNKEMPPMEAFCSMMINKFKSAKSISISCSELNLKEAEIDELLVMLQGLCKILSFKSIKIDVFWWEKITDYQVTLLTTLLQTAGENIEHFILPSPRLLYPNAQLPVSLLEAAAEYCPNLKSLFPESPLDESVTSNNYFTLCKRLTKLENLSIGTHSFSLKDEDFIVLLGYLPCLSRISVLETQLTVASLSAASKLLPHLTYVNIAGIVYTKDNAPDDKSLKASSYVELNNLQSDHIASYQILEFLQSIPPLTMLVIRSSLTTDNALLLVPQFSQVEFSNLVELTVEHKSLLAASHLLNVTSMSKLKVVNMAGYLPSRFEEGWNLLKDNADALFRSFFDHCPNIKELTISSANYLTDEHVAMLCNGLPCLTYLSIVYSAPLLTKQSLISMARTGKVWEFFRIPVEEGDSEITIHDLMDVIDNHGLKLQKLEFTIRRQLHELYKHIITSKDIATLLNEFI